jgi:hypothetical protein
MYHEIYPFPLFQSVLKTTYTDVTYDMYSTYFSLMKKIVFLNVCWFFF